MLSNQGIPNVPRKFTSRHLRRVVSWLLRFDDVQRLGTTLWRRYPPVLWFITFTILNISKSCLIIAVITILWIWYMSTWFCRFCHVLCPCSWNSAYEPNGSRSKGLSQGSILKPLQYQRVKRHSCWWVIAFARRKESQDVRIYQDLCVKRICLVSMDIAPRGGSSCWESYQK